MTPSSVLLPPSSFLPPRASRFLPQNIPRPPRLGVVRLSVSAARGSRSRPPCRLTPAAPPMPVVGRDVSSRDGEAAQRRATFSAVLVACARLGTTQRRPLGLRRRRRRLQQQTLFSVSSAFSARSERSALRSAARRDGDWPRERSRRSLADARDDTRRSEAPLRPPSSVLLPFLWPTSSGLQPTSSTRQRARRLPEQDLRVTTHDVVGPLAHDLVAESLVEAAGARVER
jgi:hypothetical protein